MQEKATIPVTAGPVTCKFVATCTKAPLAMHNAFMILQDVGLIYTSSGVTNSFMVLGGCLQVCFTRHPHIIEAGNLLNKHSALHIMCS